MRKVKICLMIFVAVMVLAFAGVQNALAETPTVEEEEITLAETPAVEEEVSTSRFVQELRQWDWSLGGAAYLIRDGDFYYTAGAKRDLGGLFNWIPEEKYYFQFGYLNSKVLSGSGGREFGYAGFASNANFVVQSAVSGVNHLLDANFKTPALLDHVLATVGVLAAKRMNDDFWTLKEGWDYGFSVDVLKLITADKP